MSATGVMTQKTQTRRDALARRRDARSADAQAAATAHLLEAIAATPQNHIVSGYMAIRTEIDPMPVMHALSSQGRQVCVPVIQGHAMPLIFREWTPDCDLIEGDFGALIPRGGAEVTPQTLITPLLAFDAMGNRMGYGGGFYDRTLERLRAARPTLAIGYAFGAQEVERVPAEPTDQPLDAIVTEAGIRHFP